MSLPSSQDLVLFNEIDYLPRKYALRVSALPAGLFPMLLFTSDILEYHPEPFSEADIVAFLSKLNHRLHISTECWLAMAVYIVRTLEKGLELQPQTWRPMLLACLVLSLKLWRDQPYLNSAVAVTCDLYSVRAVNAMEMLMARFLEWELHINAEEYAKLSSQVAMA
jgi:hypothetical protein